MDMWLFIVIGQLVLAFALTLGIRKMSPTLALLLFFVYAATMGITLGVILLTYELGDVAAAGLSAAGVFAGAAAFGAVTKRNLATMGGYLSMALIGLLVAMIVNMFIGWETLNFVISIVGVLIFTGLTAWDVQRIQRGEVAAFTGSMEKSAVMGAFILYLDFVNLFFFLLRLFGGRTDLTRRGTSRAAGIGGDERPATTTAQPLRQSLGRHRPVEPEALPAVAAGRSHQLELLVGLDPLGDDIDAEAVGERHDGAHDGLGGAVLAEARDERSVDLDRVEGELAQVGQR
jgi:FtsH-binding integral membrane protein